MKNSEAGMAWLLLSPHPADIGEKRKATLRWGRTCHLQGIYFLRSLIGVETSRKAELGSVAAAALESGVFSEMCDQLRERC